MPAETSEIIKHPEADPADVTWLADRGPQAMEVVEAKADWASTFGLIAQQLRGALDDDDGGGGVLVAVEHVGSTSVPGLAARDVLDIDLVVADAADEAAYAAPLEAVGFRFLLRRREPAWQGHRLFVRDEPPQHEHEHQHQHQHQHQQPVNLHVFGPDAAELVRHRLFRNHLRTHDADRARYEDAKREAMRRAREAGGGVSEYNERKQQVIRDILDRAYRENGLVTP